MRLFAALCVFELPLAALVWLAVQTHSDGLAGGVYWLLSFAAVVVGLIVVAAHRDPQGRVR